MDYTGRTAQTTVTLFSRGVARDVTYTLRLEGSPNDAGMVRGWDDVNAPGDPDYIGRGHWIPESEIK